MDIKEIIKIYGLPEDASEDDVRTALKAGAQAIDDLAAERARAEASEDDAKAAARTSYARSRRSASLTTRTFQNFVWQTRNNP